MLPPPARWRRRSPRPWRLPAAGRPPRGGVSLSGRGVRGSGEERNSLRSAILGRVEHRPAFTPAGEGGGSVGRSPPGAGVVILGDRPADMTCGRGVAARAIGVATGSYPPAALAEAGAYAVFDDFSDPARVLDAIFA